MGIDKNAGIKLQREVHISIQAYRHQAASLLLYQDVLTSAVGQAFTDLLNALIEAEPIRCHRAYGQWFSALANGEQSWQQHLSAQILKSDNAFAQRAQIIAPHKTNQSPASFSAKLLSEKDLEDAIAPEILAAAHHDLSILHRLYHLPPERLSQWIQQLCQSAPPPVMRSPTPTPSSVSFINDPDWTPASASASASASVTALAELANHYRSHGVGLFSQFMALRWQSNSPNTHAPNTHGSNAYERNIHTPNTHGQLVGIASPDPIQLQQLAAYEHPKQQLIQNTEALLQGYTAQNVLLYGSRGAGKSSLVKALLNEYSDRGLRLIEVPKGNLYNLPQILEPLSRVPQKFIIFVDDLSFEDDDEAFKALKVVLEGGVTARPQNVVVYATSNRRHLIREFFDERPRPKDAEEIQAWDTVQEKLSFSDRFGLTLTFTPADQPTYLAIVRELASQANLTIDPEHLDWRARQWATRHNGRSGRTARQFVDFLIAEAGNT